MKATFQGIVRDGRLDVDRKRLAEMLKSLEGKLVTLTLEERRPHRSLQANRYYRGVVLKIFADHLGYVNPDDLHVELRAKFLTDHSDEKLPRVRHTADLNSKEFADFVDRVVYLAAEYGCPIPGPNEVAA